MGIRGEEEERRRSKSENGDGERTNGLQGRKSHPPQFRDGVDTGKAQLKGQASKERPLRARATAEAVVCENKLQQRERSYRRLGQDLRGFTVGWRALPAGMPQEARTH